ncbi:MAG TPA: alpha/beta hydrolase, partial [Candidatus Limnocylindrales bacterium]
LLGACSPAPTPPPSGGPDATDVAETPSATPSDATPGPSPTPAPLVVAPASWSDCGRGFLCAAVRVPKDYASPSSGYVNVSIVNLPATDRKHRIGSLVVNPGGPGASGVEFVRDEAAVDGFPAALRKEFDIIGFDPRGVNSSTAVRCIDNLDGRAEIDPSPDNAAELKALVADARAYAAACAKRNEALLPYLSTDAVARDLDAIRQAVGDKQLTYLGFSYGTLIGSTYAELFPDHIRAMALDGAVDPALDLEQLRAGQAKGFEGALSSFLKDCAARTACAFHQDGRSVAAFNALMASIDTKPLHAVRLRDRRLVGPGIAWYSVLAALYSKDAWPTLAASLALAKAGDGSLMLLIADPYRGRKANGSYSNEQDAYTANICLDFPAPTDVAAYTGWAKAFDSAAPHFAALIAYNDLSCAFWPVPAERVPAPVTAAGAPPIVVVGTTGDPATPYPWAVALARELDSGVLITHKGEGHTAWQSSSCVQHAVDRYLLDLIVPKAGLTCS